MHSIVSVAGVIENPTVDPRRSLFRLARKALRALIGAGLSIGISTLPIMGLAAEASGNLKPYSIDDYLSLAALRKGASQGGRVVWEQAPPYDRIGYYGFNHGGSWGQAGFQLQYVDIGSKSLRPKLLFSPEPKTSYWFDSFSPGSRYIAFFASKEDAMYQGVFDTVENRVRKFDVFPLLNWGGATETVWINEEEFVFSAYGPDQRPLALARPFTGRKSYVDASRSWSGGLSVSSQSNALESSDEKTQIPGNLYKANARTGKLELLAAGRYQSPKVSSDGRYLAALRQERLPDQDPNKLNNAWLGSRFQLVVFDLKKNTGGKVVDRNVDVFPETLSWSPDAPRLACFGWKSGNDARSGTYRVYDADKETFKEWPHLGLELASERERGFGQKPERVVWLGKGLAVFARENGGNEAKFSYRDIERAGAANSPGKADWIYFDESGRHENLTARFKAISAVPSYANASSMVVLADDTIWRVAPGHEPERLAAGVEGALHQPFEATLATVHKPFQSNSVFEVHGEKSTKFVLVNLETGDAKEVVSPTATAEILTASVEAGAVLFRQDHAEGADLILKFADGRQLVVDKLNQHLAHVAKTVWRSVSYKISSQGTERSVDGCLLVPADYQPARRYPMIVEVYPDRSNGTCRGEIPSRYDRLGGQPGPYSEHLLAAKGYVVFQPNTSRDLIRSNEGPIGAMPDVVSQGIDAMIEQGYTDPKRIGLLGVSQGGFSSLWVAAKSNRFKATVTINGWADMYSHYFDTTYLHKYYTDIVRFNGNVSRYQVKAGSDFSIGRSPFDDPDAYVRNSPLFHAPDFAAPVLLIHSDMDAFALQQYEHMFSALSIQGKPARLLRYWGEGHGPSSPANIRHMWGQIFDWYDRYVMRAE